MPFLRHASQIGVAVIVALGVWHMVAPAAPQQLFQHLRTARMHQAQDAVSDAQTRLCVAQARGDGKSMGFYQKRVSITARAYRRVSGLPYSLPRCEALVADGPS